MGRVGLAINTEHKFLVYQNYSKKGAYSEITWLEVELRIVKETNK